MEKITITVEVPDGYQFNEKKFNTNDFLVTKKDDFVVRWVDGKIEINADDEHFLLNVNSPTAITDWDGAKKVHDNNIWKLPEGRHFVIIKKYLNEINKIIKENNGFEIINGTYWCAREKNDNCWFCSWTGVGIDDDEIIGDKSKYRFIRLINNLNK